MGQNLYIIPYTAEKEYKQNINEILTLLKDKNEPSTIVLTEGEYSYIHNSHDAFEYSKKYNIQHINHITLSSMLKCSDKQLPWSAIKYIVCIDTWSSAIIDNCFSIEHPELKIIHIQGPILPKQYILDKVENLERFNTTIDYLVNNLTF